MTESKRQGGAVSVFVFDLRAPFTAAVLSAEERARAGRFRNADAGRRWAAGRAGLRLLLAEATGADPAQLVLTRGEHGKPGLAGSSLRFNKSDSGEVAAVALCESREVGLDIERHRDVKRSDRIAARFFSLAERTELDGLGEPARRRAFFDCWTMKEAVLKCDGGGLGAIPMASYSAPLDPGWSGPIDGKWWAARLDAGADMSAAVVLEGPEKGSPQITSPTGGVAALA